MTTKDHLQHFMARRKWAVLSARYGCSVYKMVTCRNHGRRPQTLTPDEWEDILVYRQEWQKAKDQLEAMK